MQNVDLEEVEALLLHFNNNVPKVIGAIECRVQQKGTRTFIPPAFYNNNNFPQSGPALQGCTVNVPYL